MQCVEDEKLQTKSGKIMVKTNVNGGAKMPYFNVQTNAKVENKSSLIKELSSFIAKELGKPERYVMVSLEEKNMLFGGSEELCAFVDLRSIGLPETRSLSKAICDFLSKSLKIDADRIYINFVDVKGSMWGWNGSTF